MANFIDFVVEASKDNKLGQEFVNKIQESTPKELSDWFNSKGFKMTEEECKKLINSKDSIKNSSTLGNY